MHLEITQLYIVVLLLLALISTSIISYAVLTQNFSKKMDAIVTTNFTVDITIVTLILINILVLKTPFFSS